MTPGGGPPRGPPPRPMKNVSLASCGNDVEPALRVQVDAVVARANPVAVVVDERGVEREELQRAVHVEDRRERLRSSSGGVWFRTRVRLTSASHAFGSSFDLDLVEASCTAAAIVAEVLEPAAAARAARHLPARAVRRLEPVVDELLVELLRVDVDAPAFAVDHDADEVRLRRREVARARLRGRAPRAGSVGSSLRVEQVQRAVAAEPLLVVREVHRDVERVLPSRRHHEERRRAAEVHADVLVGLAVDDERRRHFDVRVVEGRHLLFPVVVLELEEQRAQRRHVVERLVAVRLHVVLASGAGRARPVPRRRRPGRRACRVPSPAATPGTHARLCARRCSAGCRRPCRTGRRSSVRRQGPCRQDRRGRRGPAGRRATGRMR